MGAIMLAQVISGGIQGAMNVTTGTTEACDELRSYDKQLAAAKEKWNSILADQEAVDYDLSEFTTDLEVIANSFNIAISKAKEEALQKHYITSATISFVIFTIIILLIIKRFNIFKNLQYLI